ncbi:PLC-like phosphodiesterase [Cladorrhinum sp. PSN332]|nr:PLC-like phosphodiesterase [Cladorrhinum sp. PSN332]
MKSIPLSRASAILLLLLLLTISPALISAQSAAAGTPSPTPLQVTPFTTTNTSPPTSSPSTPCNNSPLLCTRPYNNITHMGAHDSSFLRDASTSNSIAGNQYFNATVALSAGIRLLTAQVHTSSSDGGSLHLCHSYCGLLDAGPLTTWLSSIKYWLDTNPNEVVTLILVNSDNQPASAFGSDFDASGISSYGYVPGTSNTSSTSWPTLQSMISSNKRLVTFIASITASPSDYPFLLPEFQYVFETPYNITAASQFQCQLDRPSSAGTAAKAIQSGLLPLINHFQYIDLGSGVQIPDASDADATNSPGSNAAGNLGKHLQQCQGEWNSQTQQQNQNQKPVFALVDFFDRGPSVEAADLMNGLSADQVVGRVKPSSASTSSAAAAGKDGVGGASVPVVALVGFLGVALLLL